MVGTGHVAGEHVHSPSAAEPDVKVVQAPQHGQKRLEPPIAAITVHQPNGTGPVRRGCLQSCPVTEPSHGAGSSRAVGTESPVEMIDLPQAGDASLVVAIGRWNESALAEVYRRHGGAVHALARKILGSDGRAEDLTQEVFVRPLAPA